MAKLRQYELTTSEDDPFDMPNQIFAKSRKSALSQIKRKRRKGERITSLKRSYWHDKGWHGEPARHSIAARKGKYHYTQRYKRERIREPRLFQKSSFRTIDPGRPRGTKIIIGRLKGKKTTTTQAILRER